MYVNGCQILNSDQTRLGTKPNKGKKRFLASGEMVCKTNIPKLIEISTLMASVKRVGLYENSPGFD